MTSYEIKDLTSDDCYGKLKYFIYLTNEYGIPSGTNKKSFVNVFGDIIINDNFLRSNDNLQLIVMQSELSKLWSLIASDADSKNIETKCNGGFAFYYQLYSDMKAKEFSTVGDISAYIDLANEDRGFAKACQESYEKYLSGQNESSIGDVDKPYDKSDDTDVKIAISVEADVNNTIQSTYPVAENKPSIEFKVTPVKSTYSSINNNLYNQYKNEQPKPSTVQPKPVIVQSKPVEVQGKQVVEQHKPVEVQTKPVTMGGTGLLEKVEQYKHMACTADGTVFNYSSDRGNYKTIDYSSIPELVKEDKRGSYVEFISKDVTFKIYEYNKYCESPVIRVEPGCTLASGSAWEEARKRFGVNKYRQVLQHPVESNNIKYFLLILFSTFAESLVTKQQEIPILKLLRKEDEQVGLQIQQSFNLENLANISDITYYDKYDHTSIKMRLHKDDRGNLKSIEITDSDYVSLDKSYNTLGLLIIDIWRLKNKPSFCSKALLPGCIQCKKVETILSSIDCYDMEEDRCENLSKLLIY